MKLWLDDFRKAPKGWTWAKTYDEAMIYLKSFPVYMVSLDHDLGDFSGPKGREMTGYDVLKEMCDMSVTHGRKFGTVYAHTANPVARIKMNEMIERYL